MSTHAEQLLESYGARDQAMLAVDLAARDAWKEMMFDLVLQVARSMPRFTADDVCDLIPAGAPTTRDNRAFGPVMARAARLAVCRKAGIAQVPSRRKQLHATPLEVWDSLICAANDNDRIAA